MVTLLALRPLGTRRALLALGPRLTLRTSRARRTHLALHPRLALRPSRPRRTELALLTLRTLVTLLALRTLVTLLALRTLGTSLARRTGRARRTLRPSRPRRTDLTLRALSTGRATLALRPSRPRRTDLTLLTLRACCTGLALFTLRPRLALRARRAGLALQTLRSLRTGRSRRPRVALRTRPALRPGRPGRTRRALLALGPSLALLPLRPRSTLRAGRACIALLALRTSWAGCALWSRRAGERRAGGHHSPIDGNRGAGVVAVLARDPEDQAALVASAPAISPCDDAQRARALLGAEGLARDRFRQLRLGRGDRQLRRASSDARQRHYDKSWCEAEPNSGPPPRRARHKGSRPQSLTAARRSCSNESFSGPVPSVLNAETGTDGYRACAASTHPR